MITTQTTLIIAICIGITAFSVFCWLIERDNHRRTYLRWQQAIADRRESDARWLRLVNDRAAIPVDAPPLGSHQGIQRWGSQARKMAESGYDALGRDGLDV